MGPSPMLVAASWDAASHTADEQIDYCRDSPSYRIVIHIHANCDKDPWMYYASCSLISQANAPPAGPLSGYHFIDPYPVSGAALTKAQKEALNALTAPSAGFMLPPTTPPVIASPVRDGIYRDDTPVNVAIRRPTDGDERWYAEHPLEFDVEFEVWRPDFGMMWVSVSPALLLGRATLTTDLIRVALTKFVTHGPGKSGEWQTWRVRARVRDSVISRPWSDWQPFNSFSTVVF